MSNKLVTVLIILNALILLGLVWLIGALTGITLKDEALSESGRVLRDRLLPPSATNEPFGEAARPPTTVVYRSEIYTPAGEVETLQPGGAGQVTAGNASTAATTGGQPTPLPDIRPVAPVTAQDAAYVAALQSLKPAEPTARAVPKVDPEVARTQKVKRTSTKDEHYNKVDVSATRNATPDGESATTAQKLELLALHSLEENGQAPGPGGEPAHNDAYLRSLRGESRERVNESRTVLVQRGDTLFEIARRAYGDGFQYPKIFAANPHLTSPDLIEVGDVLRVPW